MIFQCFFIPKNEIKGKKNEIEFIQKKKKTYLRDPGTSVRTKKIQQKMELT